MPATRIEPGAYEMKGTYGHIVYRRGEDPDRRVYGVPVKVLWPNQVQYRCSFVLEVLRETGPGTWEARLRGAVFELRDEGDGSLRGEASFPDGTTGSVYLGREMGFERRPVILTARSLPDGEGGYETKSFAGEVALRGTALQAEMLHARAADPDDPDLTMRSPAA